MNVTGLPPFLVAGLDELAEGISDFTASRYLSGMSASLQPSRHVAFFNAKDRCSSSSDSRKRAEPTSYLPAAGYTLLIYDHLSTIPDEVRVWNLVRAERPY